MLNTKYQRSLILALFLIAIFASFFFFYDNKRDEEIAMILEKLEYESNFRDQVTKLNILAPSFAIYNISTDTKVFRQNNKEVRPLASLIKTLTVVTALEQADFSEEIKISKEALSQNGDYGLRVGEVWKTKDLMKFTLIQSSNDASYALTHNNPVFLDLMNQKGKDIGLTHSTFLNVTGLDLDKEKAGAFGTVEDMNKLAIYAYKNYPDILTSTISDKASFKSISGFIYNIENTNTIVNKIPNLLFSKTGFTDIAGGNLSIIFKNKNGQDIAITLLGSSMEGRFIDMEKLVNLMYNLEHNE